MRSWWQRGALLAFLGLLPTLGSAQEVYINLPKSEAADLFAKAEEHAALTAKVAALERHIQLLERRDALIQELDQLKDAKLALQAELTKLALQETAFWRKRAESVEQTAKAEIKSARMKAYAAIGAATGSVVFPPFGILIGAGLGLVAGWMMP